MSWLLKSNEEKRLVFVLAVFFLARSCIVVCRSIIACCCLVLRCSFSVALFASTTATATASTCRLLLLEEELVVVHKLNDCHIGVVTKTVTNLEDTRVSTRTVGNALSYIIEELSNRVFVLEVRKYLAARVCCVRFAFRQEGFYIFAEGTGLRERSRDALVLDERASHIGQHRFAMGGFTTEVVKTFAVSHGSILESGEENACLNLVFVEAEFADVHTKSEVLFGYKLLEFSERLFTEVTELHHV